MIMIFSIFVYIPTLLFIFILLVGTLKGFSRGLRKSTILLINSIVAIVLSLIVFLVIFKGDFDTRIIELANKFGISFKDLLNTQNSYDSLSKYIREIAWEKMPQDYISSNGLLTIISNLMALVESLVKLVMILVLYFVYYIFKGLFYIIYLIFFKESRYKKKATRKLRSGLREKEYKKKRGYGALLGFGRGLCYGLLVFSFIGSLFHILSGGYYSEDKQDIVIEVNGTKYDITEYYDIVNRYGTVGIGKILESVKTKDKVPVYLLAADYLTKGDYTVGIDENSLYGREELAPLVGFVKETAFLALDYGFDTSRISDIEYLIWFLSTENQINNVCFADKLETVVDRYDFGSYTLFLAQSLAEAIANSFINSEEQMSFASKLMYHLFKGENRIEAKDVINNENVDIILKLALNVAKNFEEINAFVEGFTSNDVPEEKLLFGVRKQNSANPNNALVFANVIEDVSNAITSLTFLQGEKADQLISDIVIDVLEFTMPDFSVENIKNKEDLCSIYNVKWNDGLKEIFDIAYDLVMFISQNDIKELPDLLDKLILSDDAKATEFVNRLIGSDFAGAFLNADGFVVLINKQLVSTNISLPQDIIYGNYYQNGTLVKGEVSRLFDALDEKLPTLYQLYKDEKMNVIGEWVSEERGLLPLLSSMLNEEHENYSKLLHYTISDVLFNLNFEGFEIVIPDESINQSIIFSSELVNFVNVLIEAKISDLKDAPANVKIEEFFIEKVVKLNDASQTSFVNCNILNATLVNFLQTVSIEQNGSSYNIVLPNEVLKPNVSRKMVTKEEFSKLVVALDKAFDGEYSLERFNDFDHLLEDDAIEAISQSKILHATLVTALVGICTDFENNSGLLLRIPDNYKNQDFVNNFSNTTWVLDGELARLAKGIKALDVSVNNLSVSDAEILKLAIEPKAENSKLSIMLDSNVMVYTLSKELSGIDGLMVVDALYEDLFNSVAPGVLNSRVIKKSEISDFFNSIYLIVGREELEAGMNFEEISSIVNIDYIKNKGLLNYNSLEPIMASVIIETKISQIIVKEESIVVPAELDFELVTDGNIYNWLSMDSQGNPKNKGECKRILDILDEIGLIDVVASGGSGIDMNQFLDLSDDKIDLILTSDVIHATFINEFYKECETSSDVFIPTSYDLYVNGQKEPINKENIKKHFNNLQIVKNEEISKLLKGIRYFNLDFKNLSVDPDVLLTLDEIAYDQTTKLDVIYQSDILWLTLSEQIMSQEQKDKVKVPYYLINESRYQSTDRYISLSEVNNLIKAMDYLLITSFESEINSDILANKKINLDGALESRILWYTISDNLVNSSIEKPTTSIYTSINYINGSYEFVKESEIIALKDSINKLGIENNVDSINPDDIIDIINNSNNDQLVTELCESTIIWFNISNKVNQTSDLVKPIDVVNTITEGTKKDTFISVSELNSLINSAKRLSLMDSIKNGNSVSASVFNQIGEQDIDYVLTSNIIHATIIYKFYTEMTDSNAISIPSVYQGTFDLDIITNNYSNLAIKTDGEIKKILLSASELNIDLGNPSVDANVIFNLDKMSEHTIQNQTKLDVIYQSQSIWLTLTDQILDQQTNGTIEVPTLSIKDEELYNGMTDYFISKIEINNLISSLRLLGITDIKASISSDTLMSKDFTIQEKDTILSSNILWNTISQKISEVDALLKPMDAYGDLNYQDNSGKYRFISKTEIWAIQDVLKNKLELTSIETIDTDDVFTSLETKIKAGNDQIVNEICESYSLWYTISDKVFNSNDLVVPTIVNYQVSQALYIQKTELTNLIKTAVDFDILSCVSNGQSISSASFDNKSRSELELAFSSDIIHATIILRFYEETDGEAGLNLPNRYKLSVSIGDLKSDLRLNILNYNIYNDYEVLNMLLGATELGMSFESPTISTNDVLDNDLNGASSEDGKTKIDILYESKIIWLTLSQRIIDEQHLNIPVLEVLDNRFEIFDKTLDSDRTLRKLEVSNLISAAKKLGIDDLTSDIDQYVIFQREDVTYEDITSSKIVWYTVSTKMFNDTTFEIPRDHIYKYVSATFDERREEYTYITEEELDALIYSCRMLGVDEDTIISVNCVFDYDRNETNMVELCRSYIIWFTISRKMGEKSDTIKVPNHLKITEDYQDEQGNPIKQVYIFKEELDSLVNSLYELIDPSLETGKRNVHEFNIDKYLDGSYTLDKWEHLWNDGQILWYTISDGIFNASKLSISRDVVEVISNANFIKHAELEKFMTAVNTLAPSNFESTDVEFHKILSSIDTLVLSEIFRSTISTEIIKGGQKVSISHIDMSYAYNDSTKQIYSIFKEDIVDFVNCAKLVGMTDYDDTPTLNSEDDVIILSNSHILCMTYNSEIDTFVTIYDYTNPDDVNEVYQDIEILYYDDIIGIFVIEMVNVLSEESILEFAKVKTA